jgi:hypothetical protein
MDEIDFDLSCFDLSDTAYEVGGEIDWLEAATMALRRPLPEPMPRERAPRSSYTGIQVNGFDDESITVERVRAEPTDLD